MLNKIPAGNVRLPEEFCNTFISCFNKNKERISPNLEQHDRERKSAHLPGLFQAAQV